jgi:hypothetical protein
MELQDSIQGHPSPNPSHDGGVVPVYGAQDGVTPRLVTCGGAFDWSIGHYVDNVIAFATLAA